MDTEFCYYSVNPQRGLRTGKPRSWNPTKVVRGIVLWIRSFATIVVIPTGVWERENPVLHIALEINVVCCVGSVQLKITSLRCRRFMWFPPLLHVGSGSEGVGGRGREEREPHKTSVPVWKSYRYESRTGTRLCRSNTVTGMNSHRYDSYWYEISCWYHINKNIATIRTGWNSYRYESRTGIM